MEKASEAVTIRPQMVKDARTFYRILTDGNFRFFPVNVPSIAAEQRFLRGNIKQMREQKAWHFSIFFGDRLAGAVGVMPETGRPYCAEIGYFIDAELHGRGIAVQAVRLAEKYVLDNLPQIRRLFACMVVDNAPSARVAEKAGFSREGRLKEYLKVGDIYHDAWIYGKLIR